MLDAEQLQSHLARAVERLRAALAPVAVYFYGSYVYGTPDSDGDLDLLVVVEDTLVPPFERDAIADRALGDLPLPIDVQVYTREEFEHRAALPVSFERTVKTKGRLVYAA
jgi:predicted nucleotidyltransferase